VNVLTFSDLSLNQERLRYRESSIRAQLSISVADAQLFRGQSILGPNYFLQLDYCSLLFWGRLFFLFCFSFFRGFLGVFRPGRRDADYTRISNRLAEMFGAVARNE